MANLIFCFLAMKVKLPYEQIVPFQKNRGIKIRIKPGSILKQGSRNVFVSCPVQNTEDLAVEILWLLSHWFVLPRPGPFPPTQCRKKIIFEWKDFALFRSHPSTISDTSLSLCLSIFLNIYSFLRVRETDHERERDRERGKRRI